MFPSEKVVYKTVGDREVTALVIRGKKLYGKAPVCFWFHGGGWICGDGHEPDYRPVLTQGLLDAGVTIVSCEYRHADGVNVLWKELIGDCSDFVRYFTKNADAFGLDMDRAFTAGISAGGHLCLLEAYGGEYFGTDDGTEFPKFRFILDMCGPVDMREALSAKEKGAIMSFLRKFLGRDSSEWEKIYPLVSPIDYAEKADVSRVAPVMAVQGDADELVDPKQPEILREFYRRIGVEFELLNIKNGSHGFDDVPGLPPAEPKPDDIQLSQLRFALAHL